MSERRTIGNRKDASQPASRAASSMNSRHAPNNVSGWQPTGIAQISSDSRTALHPPEPSLRPRRSITSSLYNLFNKPNLDRAKGHFEHGPAAPAPRDLSAPRPSTRLSLRYRSTSRNGRRSPEPLTSNTQDRPSSRLTIRRASRSKQPQIQDQTPTHVNTPWDPPPLFQAYPQAVRHSCLESARALFESSQYNHGNAQVDRATKLSRRRTIFGWPKPSEGQPSRPQKPPQPKSKKIYILVTSGRLLEYAADGPSDRLPEKVLSLGKESAAFVSNLIRDRQYVLHVLAEGTDSEMQAPIPQNSFMSRLGLQGQASRRFTSSLLLVFNQAEELDSWINSLRREIASLGGKRYRPTSTARNAFDDDAVSIATCHRYEGLQRSQSWASSHPPSLRAVPFTSMLPGSPTSPAIPNSSTDRVDSGNFASVDADGSRMEESQQETFSASQGYPHAISDQDLFGDVTAMESASTTSEADLYAPVASAPALHSFQAQEYFDFTFEDLSPHIAIPERQNDASPPSLPPKSRRRSTESLSKSHLNTDEKSQRHSSHTLHQRHHSKERQPTITTYRGWSSVSGPPRYSLSPQAYSQQFTPPPASPKVADFGNQSSSLRGNHLPIHRHSFVPQAGTDNTLKDRSRPQISKATVTRLPSLTVTTSPPSNLTRTTYEPTSSSPTIPSSLLLPVSSSPTTSFRSNSLITLPTVQPWSSGDQGQHSPSSSPDAISPNTPWPSASRPSSPRVRDGSTSPFNHSLRRPVSLPVHKSNHAPFLASSPRSTIGGGSRWEGAESHIAEQRSKHSRSVAILAIRPATVVHRPRLSKRVSVVGVGLGVTVGDIEQDAFRWENGGTMEKLPPRSPPPKRALPAVPSVPRAKSSMS